ncbi:MAG TPA: glycosyltransferase family 4 protein [archaeon]|nr:glycosyltransferase family 4 protein [archaeon]
MAYNILLINWRDIAHPEAGGAEVHAHEIFRRIAASGHRVTFLCARWPGCEPRAEIDGIEILRAGRNMTFNFTAAALLRGELSSRDFDIIVEDVNKIPFCTPWFTPHPKLILFHHLFGTTIFREVAPPVAAYVYLWERLIPMIYRGEWVQAVSKDTADELIRMGFAKEKIRLIYNAVDCNLYSPAPPDREEPPAAEPYFLYMGRIKRYKRLGLILDAFSLARRQGLDSRIRLIFAGAGDDYPGLRERAAKLGLLNETSFLGRVSEEEKVRLLRGAVAVANPSPKEGWGITNMEAQACATPVVASRSPGLRESVKDGLTGFLFSPGDPADFAAKLLLIAGDESLRRRMKSAAREFAQTFSWDTSAEKTICYIEDILEKRI